MYAYTYKHGIGTIDPTGSIYYKYIRRTRGGYETTLSIYNHLTTVDISNCTDVITSLQGQLKGLPSPVACLEQCWVADGQKAQKYSKTQYIPSTSMEGYLTWELPLPQVASLCLTVLNGFFQELLILTMSCNKGYHSLGVLT